MGMNDFLKKHEFKPAKWMGQNFLIDRGALKKIVEAGELTRDDIIVEVGPGFGVLTFELAEKVKKVIAVEKDKTLAKILKERLLENKISNVLVIEGDILKMDISELIGNYSLQTTH